MNVREAYQTLELDYGTSLDEIDKADRNLIRVWHPDRFIKSPDPSSRIHANFTQTAGRGSTTRSCA